MSIIRLEIYAFMLFLACAQWSCKKEEPGLSPVIQYIYTPSEHGVGLYATAGNTNRFYITVSDDKALQDIQVKLETPGGYHSHIAHGGGMIGAFKAPNIGNWDPVKSMELQGTDSVVIFKFNAPKEISGAWNLKIALLDSDGNISYKDESVMILNDSIPAILPVASVPTADASGIVQLKPGDHFTFEGTIVDVNYLESVNARLYSEQGIVWHQEWNFDHEWMFSLASIQLPAFAETGNYTLIIEAYDKDHWHNWIESSIQVKK